MNYSEKQKDLLFRDIKTYYALKLSKTDGEPSEIVAGLFIGSIGSIINQAKLTELGINKILFCFTLFNPLLTNLDYQELALSTTDDESQINQFLLSSYSIIQNSLENSKKLLVVCFQGACASAAVLLHYLIKKNNFTFLESLQLLQSKRPQIKLLQSFKECLKQFEEEVLAQETQLFENCMQLASNICQTDPEIPKVVAQGSQVTSNLQNQVESLEFNRQNTPPREPQGSESQVQNTTETSEQEKNHEAALCSTHSSTGQAENPKAFEHYQEPLILEAENITENQEKSEQIESTATNQSAFSHSQLQTQPNIDLPQEQPNVHINQNSQLIIKPEETGFQNSDMTEQDCISQLSNQKIPSQTCLNGQDNSEEVNKKKNLDYRIQSNQAIDEFAGISTLAIESCSPRDGSQCIINEYNEELQECLEMSEQENKNLEKNPLQNDEMQSRQKVPIEETIQQTFEETQSLLNCQKQPEILSDTPNDQQLQQPINAFNGIDQPRQEPLDETLQTQEQSQIDHSVIISSSVQLQNQQQCQETNLKNLNQGTTEPITGNFPLEQVDSNFENIPQVSVDNTQSLTDGNQTPAQQNCRDNIEGSMLKFQDGIDCQPNKESSTFEEQPTANTDQTSIHEQAIEVSADQEEKICSSIDNEGEKHLKEQISLCSDTMNQFQIQELSIPASNTNEQQFEQGQQDKTRSFEETGEKSQTVKENDVDVMGEQQPSLQAFSQCEEKLEQNVEEIIKPESLAQKDADPLTIPMLSQKVEEILGTNFKEEKHDQMIESIQEEGQQSQFVLISQDEEIMTNIIKNTEIREFARVSNQEGLRVEEITASSLESGKQKEIIISASENAKPPLLLETQERNFETTVEGQSEEKITSDPTSNKTKDETIYNPLQDEETTLAGNEMLDLITSSQQKDQDIALITSSLQKAEELSEAQSEKQEQVKDEKPSGKQKTKKKSKNSKRRT